MRKNFLHSFIFLLYALSSSFAFGQTTVTIGTGTSAGITYPITRTYDYGTSECIYLASEIGVSGTITSIEYEKIAADDGLNISSVTVYMQHTTATTLASGTFSTTGYTTVFSGTVTNSSAAGWKTITLSTPFVFNGTDNLLIAIDKGYQAASGTPANWYYTTLGSTLNRRSYGSAPNTSLTATAGRPNIKITLTTGLSYCTPTYSLGCADVIYDFINRVRIGTLDNTAAGTSVGTTCATRYVDYYSSVAAPNLAQGTSYNLLVTVGNDVGNYTAAWLDFNQDGDFLDAGEYFNGGNPGALGTATISISVPSGATLGNTRMRVRGGEDANISLQSYACGASPSGYGEAEDYKVTIISGCAVTVTGNPADACVASGGTKTFTVSATGATSYQWQVSTDGGSTYSNLSNGGNYSGVTTTSLSVTGVPGGFNGYKYRCGCINTCTTSSTGAVISVGGGPSAPTANAASGVGSYQFTANWSAVSGVSGYYLDVATTNSFTVGSFLTGYESLNVGNVTSKALTNLTCGTTYYYRVRAVNGCGTSSYSNVITRATSSCSGDNCSSPIAITVSGTCSSPWYSTALATVSTETTVCTGGVEDMWFTFVAPATGSVTIDVMGSRNFDPQFDLLSGTCASFSCVATLDNRTIAETESMYATGLTVGATYYVKVNNYGGGGSYNGEYGGFSICITSGTTAGLVNDAASGAVALTDYDCYPHDTRGWVFYSTAGATNTSEPALPTCWTSTLVANKTIWFKFTATATQQLVTTVWPCSGYIRGAADNRMAIYSSSNNLSTGTFTLIGCLEDVHNPSTAPGSTIYSFEHPAFSGAFGFNSNPDDYQTALTVTGLTIGNTYFIRMDAPDGIISICTEPNRHQNDSYLTALNAPLNTVMQVNTTGLGSWSARSAAPTAIPDLGAPGITVQNMMYYFFDCTASDLYYINQWRQVCDMTKGSQFTIYSAGLTDATLQLGTVGNNAGNTLYSSTETLADRALSVNFVAGQRYYIVWDGASGDECAYNWEITQSIPAPMPVELLNFTAHCDGGKVKAVWSTASETNNDHFVLEKSSDGVYYKEVTSVQGAGNSSTIKNYEAHDEDVIGTKYYRVKQVDHNGDFTYSNAKAVTCQINEMDITAILPVPANNFIDVYFTLNKDDQVTFEIFDLLGNKVISKNQNSLKGENIQRIDLASISGGMYYITVKSSSGIFSNKLIKR